MEMSSSRQFDLEGALNEGIKPFESDGDDQSNEDKIVPQAKDQFESTKAKMEEIMEENQRLRIYLERILKDYKTLQMQYCKVFQQEATKTPGIEQNHDDHEEGPHEPIDLNLGICLKDRNITKDDDHKIVPTIENIIVGGDHKGGLTLGLGCKFDEPKNSSNNCETSVEEVKEEEADVIWQPKTMKNAKHGEDIDEILHQNPAKRARVSVRIRCDTPTMNDGCHWRKYGQKIAKGNPCPRAYYRCTVGSSCPVRKQVQRCVEDMSILITTYEGTHNHPLSASATTMASTTSAAASMLLSGSSTSRIQPTSSSSTNTANLHGLSLSLSNSSISSYHSHPTITLDLTSSSTFPSSLSHPIRPRNIPTRFSTTNNFNSSDSKLSHISWTNHTLSYGLQTYNKNQTLDNSLSLGTQHDENLYRSYLQKTTIPNPSEHSLQHDTIAATTKAITLDPNFQSALEAALTSIIGSSSSL